MAYTDRFPIVKNFFETRLSVACDAGDSTLYLEGAENLPEFLAGRDYIPLVLRDAGTVREIVYAVAVDRAAGSVEVLRAQEGSTTNLWDVGTYVYCTMTADSLQKMRVNGFAPLVDGDNGRPAITRTSGNTATLTGDYTDQIEVGMAVRVLAGNTVIAPTDASLGAIHLTKVVYANGVTTLTFQNVTLPTTISGLDLGISVAAAPLYHPDTIVADEDTLTQNGNVLSVSEAFRAAQAQTDTAQNTAISNAATAAANAQSSADAAQATADSALAAAEEAASKAGLPLGFEYTRLTGQTPPFGGVDYLGQTATRAMYADLWAWLNENKPDAIVSESEWQSLYSSQNGNVAKYSTGDGSTTFRFPRMVGYAKGAASASEIGGYTTEGLPNITGRVKDIIKIYWNNASAHGAFSLYGTSGIYGSSSEGTTNHNGFEFDASRSNSIYGNSDHVTPETVTVVMGVIAIGAVAEIGTATEAGLVAEVAEISGNVGALESGSGFNAAGKVEIVGWGMPDYTAGVDIKSYLQAGSYTVPKDGVACFVIYGEEYWWIEIGGTNVMYLDGAAGIYTTSYLPVAKGDILQNGEKVANRATFYPYKGAI